MMLFSFQIEFNARMSSFSITRKKTPFQKHREEEEAKKKVSASFSVALATASRITAVGIYTCYFFSAWNFCRERKMKQHASMLNLWSHSKGIMLLAQKLLCEEG